MGRNTNPTLVIAAQLTGVAAGYAHVPRCTRDEALAEVADIVARAKDRPATRDPVALLSRAAVMYVQPTGPGTAAWYPAALDLLIEAGADLDLATRLHGAERGRSATIAR